MSFITRMLRYVFWLLVVSWAASILQRIVGKMAGAAAGPRPDLEVPNNAVNEKLVRDPVCGMHVAERLALPAKAGSETLYFCSAECRDRYFNGTDKISASA